MMTNANGTNIRDLNEDCLLELFSTKSLTLMDLCAVAETCTSFKQITQRVFTKELKIRIQYNYEYGGWLYSLESKYHLEVERTLCYVERIFKNFGPCLSHICIHGNNSEPVVLDLIALHCKGTVKTLKIDSLTIREILAVKLKPIFQRLVELDLIGMDIKVDKSIFANCDSLTELKISGLSNCDAILWNTFPKLKVFSFQLSTGTTLFLSFLQRHNSLKTLNFNGNVTDRCNPIFWQTIGSSCRGLEELIIKLVCDKKLDFSQLQSLKKLSLFLLCYSDVIKYVELSQALKSLESLTIDRVQNAGLEFFEALSSMKNVRELNLKFDGGSPECTHWTLLSHVTKLSISRPTFENHVVAKIIKQLTNLVEMTILKDYFYIMSEKEFFEIIKIVERREHILTIKCCCKISKNYNVYQNVRLINESLG